MIGQAAVMTALSWAGFGGLAVLAAPVISLVYGVVWLPANSGDSHVRAQLGAGHGDLVEVRA